MPRASNVIPGADLLLAHPYQVDAGLLPKIRLRKSRCPGSFVDIQTTVPVKFFLKKTPENRKAELAVLFSIQFSYVVRAIGLPGHWYRLHSLLATALVVEP